MIHLVYRMCYGNNTETHIGVGYIYLIINQLKTIYNYIKIHTN